MSCFVFGIKGSIREQTIKDVNMMNSGYDNLNELILLLIMC